MRDGFERKYDQRIYRQMRSWYPPDNIFITFFFIFLFLLSICLFYIKQYRGWPDNDKIDRAIH